MDGILETLSGMRCWEIRFALNSFERFVFETIEG